MAFDHGDQFRAEAFLAGVGKRVPYQDTAVEGESDRAAVGARWQETELVLSADAALFVVRERPRQTGESRDRNDAVAGEAQLLGGSTILRR